MNSIFLNQTKTMYFDLNQDHNHQEQQQQVLESSSYYPASVIASSTGSLHLEHGLGMTDQSMIDQSLTFDQFEGSKDMFGNMVSPTYGVHLNGTNNGSHNHGILVFKQQEDQEETNQKSSGGMATGNGSSDLRWMSSKMRMMRKMINSNNTKNGHGNGSKLNSASNKDHDHGPLIVPNNDTDIDNNSGIRVCSDCNTSKTPLWRSGPQGPKTLCNACGIRQRKARKAAMEAVAAAATNSCNEGSSSTSTKTTIKLKIMKEKNKSRTTSNTFVSQQINKKQTPCNKQQANYQLVGSDHNNSSSTTSNSTKRKMAFEEFAFNLLSKNAAFHRMFPRDEEEGALLLMALSHGLIQS